MLNSPGSAASVRVHATRLFRAQGRQAAAQALPKGTAKQAARYMPGSCCPTHGLSLLCPIPAEGIQLRRSRA